MVSQEPDQRSVVDKVGQVGSLNGSYEDAKRPIEQFLVVLGQRANEIRLDGKVEEVVFEYVEEREENENGATDDEETAPVEAIHGATQPLLRR